MPVAELILDNPTKEFERFYIKVKDQHTNLVIYSASIEESPRLLKEVGDLPGLYILQAEDSTLYVGQSKALGGRLKTHRTSRKIGFNRILAVVRDQSLAQYLDYAEAKIYDELHNRGFRLDQAPLSGSLDTKRRRLGAQDDEHVRTADIHVHQFLNYAVALGLVKPAGTAVLVPAMAVTQLIVQPATSSTAQMIPVQPICAQADIPSLFKKRKSVKLVVKDSSGKEFEGKYSADVFAAALEYLGLDRLATMDLTLGGHPLLRRDKPNLYSNESRRVASYYIATHSSNAEKAKLLRRASAALNVQLTVICAEPAPR